MCLTIESSYKQDRKIATRGLPDRCHEVSFVENDSANLLEREEDFVAWLTSRAVGFQSMSIFLMHSSSSSWLFPRLITALGRVESCTPALTLFSGEPLQSYSVVSHVLLHYVYAPAVWQCTVEASRPPPHCSAVGVASCGIMCMAKSDLFIVSELTSKAAF